MAGPNPFHKAPTPSAAMVFRAQSRKPEYIPVGADCSLDLMTWIAECLLECCYGYSDDSRTSGGMAKAHITTPAVPPAKTTAPKFKSPGEDPVGIKAFFVIS
jgi:hypothetical protein